MPHIRFNWVDILFVTLLIRIGYIGLKNGLLPEFFRLLGLLSAFLISFNNYTLLSQFLSTHTKWTGAKIDLLSFLFIFLLILFLSKALALVASLFFGGEHISSLNRIIGAILGLARGFLLISLVYMFFVNGPFEYLTKSARERSFSGRHVAGIAPVVYKIGINFYPGEKRNTPLVGLLENI